MAGSHPGRFEVTRQNFIGMLSFSILALAALVLEIMIILDGPELIDHVVAPNAATQCQQIQPGMSRGEVLGTFDVRPPELQVMYEENTIYFARGDGACTVEFDGNYAHVTATHFDRSHGSRFDPRGHN